jgi:CheY-like chemotaxis protein
MTSDTVEILLVEDDADDAELAMHALKRDRVPGSIHIARDGVEALDFLFREGQSAGGGRDVTPPKVVLLDMKLPRLDGLEVLRRMKADKRTSTIPVVMMTSSREERDVTESYRLGVNSYIVKPVDFDQFTDAVRTVGHYWASLNNPPRA